ncbi:hypothetical protein C8J48_0716 [Desmospora activa DSM 45169]|uniref:Transposase n=1 Tax=Desmospora activa DSM 45169 TaxID=1121389 RepID=A0A2T4Z8F4_9BACL|nr:hypothetical protein C8J48_0716 [Desmospora activa DSM 45169]
MRKIRNMYPRELKEKAVKMYLEGDGAINRCIYPLFMICSTMK